MMPISKRPKVAVVGAGWSGLATAITLAEHVDVTVFEASKQAGGRARSLNANQENFSFLDNGQHILLTAYHSVLALLKKIAVAKESMFLQQPLQWHMLDGLQFKSYSFAAPFHVLTAVLLAKNISLIDKMAFLNSMRLLQQWHRQKNVDMSVGTWLRQQHVSAVIIKQFWQPLVLGVLNTPIETASLRTLSHVLNDGVWQSQADSDYLVPKVGLHQLFVDPALRWLSKHQCQLQLQTRVRQMEITPYKQVEVNEHYFDAVIVAVAPYHALSLMPINLPESIRSYYEQLHYHAITTVYLRYQEAVDLPAVMTGFANGTAHWLISRAQLGLPANEVVAVISVSDQVGDYQQAQWVSKVHDDIKLICPNIGDPIASRVITEKRATIASNWQQQPDLSWLKKQNIYMAGDYLHRYYPATLEAAVQSGQFAAEQCLNNLNIFQEK